MKKIILLTLSITVVALGCSMLNKIPKHPKNISVKLFSNGGMLPVNQTVYVSNDSCVYTKVNKGNIQYIYFKLSNEQLNTIYATMYSNNFSKIESTSKPVYDRGGSEITAFINSKRYVLSNNGDLFIKPQFETNYSNIVDKIKTIAFSEIDKQKNEYIISIDKSMTNSKFNMIFYINDEEVYNEQKDGEYTPIHTTMFPKHVKFKILLMKKGGQPYQTVMSKHELVVMKLPTNKNIILTLDHNNLNIK